MEATPSQPPSPQSVGREFVRQYYTLLKKAPNYLHRFYNNHSSFTHDKYALVVGQKNIHSRIQQLNFRNCRAKISQMDAQATFGNGVVIQVTGELSNDGHVTRRFTQTFVLAAQSPKKYYVHNDIFRYQDLNNGIKNEEGQRCCVIHPGKVATGIAKTYKVRQLQQLQSTTQSVGDAFKTANTNVQQQSHPVLCSICADHVRPISVHPITTAVGSVLFGTQFANLTSCVSPQQHQIVQTTAVRDDLVIHGMPLRKTIQTQSSQSNPAPLSTVPQSAFPSVPSDEIGCIKISAGKVSNNAPQICSHNSRATTERNQQHQQQQFSNGVQTYANLFKPPSSVNNFVSAALQKQQQQTHHHSDKKSLQASLTGASTATGGARDDIRSTNNGSNDHNLILNQDNNQCYHVERAQRSSSKSFNGDCGHRRSNNFQFGDNHQLFLGNIPHHASENDLRTLFGRFGAILDLRILSKAPGKLPLGIRSPLNYGFITYKDAESVQNCLAHCPLYFPENSPGSQKLNVEEKKPRGRANELPTRQGMSSCDNTDGSGVNNKGNSTHRIINHKGPTPSCSLSNSGAGGGSDGNNIERVNGTNKNRFRGGYGISRISNAININDNRSSNNGGISGAASPIGDDNNNLYTRHHNNGVRH